MVQHRINKASKFNCNLKSYIKAMKIKQHSANLYHSLEHK